MIANEHYINKINKIREKFTRGHISPISILEKLISRPKTTFNLPYISICQTKKIIKKLKASNSLGHDESSIKISKKHNQKMHFKFTYQFS